MDVHKKREFTLHEKRISESMQIEFIELFHTNPADFKKKTAAMLRENVDLFNMNEIGTVSNESGHITLEQFQEYLDELLKPELSKFIYQCIDESHDDHTVSLPAITRFLSGRTKVAERTKTVIDEGWLVDTLKEVDIGKIDESGTNMIELDEFIHYFSNLKKEIPQHLVIKLFNDIDKNRDGKISTFEYFKWKEGFKTHKIHQYLPATIKKSTTKLKLMNAAFQQQTKHSKPDNHLYTGIHDDDEKEIDQLKYEILKLKQENNENIENDNKQMEKLKEEIEKLKQTNVTKDKEILQLKQENNENDIKVKQLNDELNDIKQLNVENMKEYDSKLDVLTKQNNELIEQKNKIENVNNELTNNINKYIENEKIHNKKIEVKTDAKTDTKTDEDVIKLKKKLAESEAELIMMERDKQNLFNQLEQTYEIVNDELVLDVKKPQKYVKRHKIKTIDDAKQLRKSLKKLKSKIDVKDQKIKKYKSERHLNSNEVDNKQNDTNNGGYIFKNLFVFLKDF